MADNVTIPASGSGTATPVVATDDVGGIHYQRVKLDLGADGSADPQVGSVTVDGTVAISGTVSTALSLEDAYVYMIPSQVHVNSASTVHWDIFNADAVKLVRIISILQIPNITAAVTGIVFDWLLERTTAVGTGGSAVTAWLPDLNQTVLDADVTCRSKPTGGATQSTDLRNYSLSSEETNAATIQIASQGGLELMPVILKESRRGVVLRQNQGIRCVQVTASIQGNTGWLITFTQE